MTLKQKKRPQRKPKKIKKAPSPAKRSLIADAMTARY